MILATLTQAALSCEIWLRSRSAVWALSRLDDRMLLDAGILRADIETHARNAVRSSIATERRLAGSLSGQSCVRPADQLAH